MNVERYRLHDSLATTASHLITQSARNTRYWVIDNTTGLAVDEFKSKSAANMAAKQMNRECGS